MEEEGRGWKGNNVRSTGCYGDVINNKQQRLSKLLKWISVHSAVAAVVADLQRDTVYDVQTAVCDAWAVTGALLCAAARVGATGVSGTRKERVVKTFRKYLLV